MKFKTIKNETGLTIIGAEWEASEEHRIEAWPEDATAIRYEAFYNCGLLSIPATWGKVTTIGGYAFSNCGLLSIPATWGNVTSIGDMAFYCCPLTSIPASWGSVTRIGDWAFYHCPLLSIPATWGKVTSIGDFAFFGSDLTSIPDSWGNVTSIGDGAFDHNPIAASPICHPTSRGWLAYLCQGILVIGCQSHPLGWWTKNFDAVCLKHNATPAETKELRQVLKHFKKKGAK